MSPAELNTSNVPDFNIDAPALRQVVDLIADHAMTGREKIAQAIATAPAELQPLLNDLKAIFSLIGHKADSTSDDIGSDMAEVWGVAAA